MRNFHLPGRSTVHSEKGMVATSHPLASHVGIETLKKGGNAVDAAIAMALVLPLCEPQSTGLFGDVFALIQPSETDEIIGINGSGKSPSNLNADFLRSKGHIHMPNLDVSSITLPGAMAAFDSLHKKFGQLNLTELCSPAIFYAENGVVVSEPKIQEIKKEPVIEKPKAETELSSKTKAELETYGRSIGLELDKRLNKSTLISQIEEATIKTEVN